MNNNDIVTKRTGAIKEANAVYDKIINNQTNLINNQSAKIDNYMKNSGSAINQSVNNNVASLQNAQEAAIRNNEAEKQRAMNKYNQNTQQPIDETVRIGMMNSAQNRIDTSNANLSSVMQEYNNQIAQAKITGQSMIAQNALEMLKEKLNLYTTSVDAINKYSADKINNQLQLTNDYASIDKGYSSALNKKLDREEAQRQFGDKMKYEKARDKVKDNQWYKEFQLALQNAKSSGSTVGSRGRRGRRGGSSGGYSLTSGKSGVAIANKKGDTYTKTDTRTMINGNHYYVYKKGGEMYYKTGGKYHKINPNNVQDITKSQSGGGKGSFGGGGSMGGFRGNTKSNSAPKKKTKSNIVSKLLQIL